MGGRCEKCDKIEEINYSFQRNMQKCTNNHVEKSYLAFDICKLRNACTVSKYLLHNTICKIINN